MALKDTATGHIILRELYSKYGTGDEAKLLEILVLQHFNAIFTPQEQDDMSEAMGLPTQQRIGR